MYIVSIEETLLRAPSLPFIVISVCCYFGFLAAVLISTVNSISLTVLYSSSDKGVIAISTVYIPISCCGYNNPL